MRVTAGNGSQRHWGACNTAPRWATRCDETSGVRGQRSETNKRDEEAETKKGSSRCPFLLLLRCGPRPATRRVLLRCCLAGSARAELLVELLDAACRVHDLLLAGVERMRFRRYFDLGERVGLAVEFGGFTRLDGRARDKLEVDRHVDEQDFAVIRVNAFFHGLSFNLAVANPRAAATNADSI